MALRAQGSGQPVQQRAPMGGSIHRDHPVTTLFSEHSTESDRCRGLADPALHAEYDDPVVVAHRRTAHKGAQLPAVPLRPGLTRIDEAPAHGEQGTPPPFAGRTPHRAQQRLRSQIRGRSRARHIRGMLAGVGVPVAVGWLRSG